jgi:hypothetical protein
MRSLGMHKRNRQSVEQAQGHEALLVVAKSVVSNVKVKPAKTCSAAAKSSPCTLGLAARFASDQQNLICILYIRMAAASKASTRRGSLAILPSG